VTRGLGSRLDGRAGRRADASPNAPPALHSCRIRLGDPLRHDLLRLVRRDPVQRHPRTADLGHHRASLRHRRSSAGARRASSRLSAADRRMARRLVVLPSVGRTVRSSRGARVATNLGGPGGIYRPHANAGLRRAVRLALPAREAGDGTLARLCGDPRRAGLPDHRRGGHSWGTQPGRNRRPGPRRRHVGRLHAAVSPQRAHADPVGGADLYLVRALLPAGLSSARPQPFRPRLDERGRAPGRLSRHVDERRRHRHLQPVRGAARGGRRHRHHRAPPSRGVHPRHPRPRRGPDAGRKRGHRGHRDRRPFRRQARTLPSTPSNPIA